MSDFLGQLEQDLVEAHARYGRRGRAGRMIASAHPRTWRPTALLTGAIVAACAIAAVIGIGTLNRPAPASLRITHRVVIGSDVADAVTGYGYLWTVDSHNGITQIDPRHGRIVRRIVIDLPLESLSAGAGAIWATTTGTPGQLVRVDPTTGRVTATRWLRGTSGVVAAHDGVVWLLGTQDLRVGLERLDPANGRTIASVPVRTTGEAIAIGANSLWTLDSRGVLVQRDLLTGRPLRRVPGLGGATDAGEKVLAADATGVWVLRPGALVRVAGDGPGVRRIPMPADTAALLAQSAGAVWTIRTAGSSPSYQLLRIDPSAGAHTGSLNLGKHQPQALVPAPDGLWVVTADGTALRVH
jgi:hypothetical protein